MASKAKNLALATLVAVRESLWVLFGFVIVAALVLGVLIALIPPLQSFVDSTLGGLVANALVYAVSLAVIVAPVFAMRQWPYVRELLGLTKRPTFETLWRPMLAWLGYMLITITVAALVRIFVPWIDSDQAQDVGFDDIKLPVEYVIAFLALVILPPIAEEFLFRGYLFGRLRGRLGFMGTTIIVSVLFGFIHGQWNVGIDTAILSIFLCYLREKTGSIWAPIVLHMIKNGLAYFILFIAPLLGINLL